MVIGHLAPVLLARSRYRELPVALLLATTYAADLCEMVLSLTGVSSATAAQYSHSVPLVAAMSLVLALTAQHRGAPSRSAAAVGLVGLSHVPLDWLTGDTKPLFFPFGPTVGLHLYRDTALDCLVEGGLCIVAWLWWSRGQRGTVIKWSGAALVLLLVFQAELISYTASHPISSLFDRVSAPSHPPGRVVMLVNH